MVPQFELGAKVKHKVTGYTGTVTARCEYLHGEPRIQVDGIDSTGRPIEDWDTEASFEAVKA